MNTNESIGLITIGLPDISVGKIPFINVFGVTDRAFDIVDTDKPWLLLEDGTPLRLEDGTPFKLEQDKMKIWRARARK